MNERLVEWVNEDVDAVLRGRVEQLAALKNGTLVVTGGTGFLGTWLTELVARLNDRHGFGTQVALVARSTDRFKLACPHLAAREDVRFLKADVRHMFEVPKETTHLVHAAANPDNRFHATNPIETMTVIGEGTSSILRAADRCSDLRMLVNVSSGLVAGSQPLELERVPESHPGAPAAGSVSSAYAEAKRYAETLCAAARSQGRIPIVTARPFAFIGPYQSLDSPWAINNFIRDALRGDAIRVFGDGQTVRSYMYATDMAFWILRLAAAGTSGLAYNVGSPEGATLESVARLVSNHFAPRPEIRLRTAPNAAQRSRFVPDVSLATKGLGLSLTVGLEDAIARTVRWNRGS
ncbi:MAG: NAD-dependent epimerase/dehydratase family protein [Planctomycetota bacterium]